MADDALPIHRTQRISLSKSQLRTELGAELLSLCQSVTADGRLAPEEAEGLRAWLVDADTAELPAAAYLREVVERILADGQITQDEYKELHKAVEAVLPIELRKQATTARKALEDADKDAARSAKAAEREQARQERERNRPVATANFMVAGVRHEGRGEVIARYASAGDAVGLVRDLGNQHSENAIAVCLSDGQQIGFVPEDEAERLAPLMDLGARADAVITKILGNGRVPIPVVQAYLRRQDASTAAPRVATNAPARRQAAAVSPGAESVGHAIGTAVRKSKIPTTVWVGLVLLALFFLAVLLAGH